MTPADPSTPFDEAARPRRRGAFATSVAVALALNAVALTVAAMSVQAWRAPANPPSEVSWVATVVPPRWVADREPVDAPPRPLAEAPPRKPEQTPTKLTADVPAATTKSPPAPSDDDRVVRFYKYPEVDRTAEPDSDWNLDASLLDGAGIRTLVFEIFIDAAGEIVACTILTPSDLPVETRSLLEERLRHTIVQPAIRAGVPVASVRRIEVSVQSSEP